MTSAIPHRTGLAVPPGAPPRGAAPTGRDADDLGALLAEARALDARGLTAPAIEAYERVAAACERGGEPRLLAETLRRLGTAHLRGGDGTRAAALLERSREAALACGDGVLVGEALHALALLRLERGERETARVLLDGALEAGAEHHDLRGRVERELGILAGWRGEIDVALGHHLRSYEAFRQANNDRGCALAGHDLGRNAARRELWEAADDYFAASLAAAEALDDASLRAGVLLDRADAQIARGHYERARASAEEALRIADALGLAGAKARSYRHLGALYRETGAPLLAEARLSAAAALARAAGDALEEGETTREMAIAHRQLGRFADTLRALESAHRILGGLDARRERADVGARLERLERDYVESARLWGRSIESTDSYTYGHSERVARYAVCVARALELDDAAVGTVRLGAYLHDIGKVRMPHEVLHKPGRLSEAELAVMQLHPIHGVEMLEAIAIPWDVRPIVRSHHERLDGTGYPDRLRGDQVPLHAQIVGIVDVYDALTTTRAFRPAMDEEMALAEMERTRHWWHTDVWDAFQEARLAAGWSAPIEDA